MTILTTLFSLALLAPSALALDLIAPNEFETRTLGTLRALVTDLSETKDVRVEMVAGTTAVEYQVYFHPQDETAVRGLSGVTQTSVSTLLNELSIASQRDQAKAAKIPFDLRHRRYLIVRYIKLDQ